MMKTKYGKEIRCSNIKGKFCIYILTPFVKFICSFFYLFIYFLGQISSKRNGPWEQWQHSQN